MSRDWLVTFHLRYSTEVNRHNTSTLETVRRWATETRLACSPLLPRRLSSARMGKTLWYSPGKRNKACTASSFQPGTFPANAESGIARTVSCTLPARSRCAGRSWTFCLFGLILALHFPAVSALSLLVWSLENNYVAVYVMEMSTTGRRGFRHRVYSTTLCVLYYSTSGSLYRDQNV